MEHPLTPIHEELKMEHNEELLKEIQGITERINELRSLTYVQYSQAVDEVLAGRITDEGQIAYPRRYFGLRR